MIRNKLKTLGVIIGVTVIGVVIAICETSKQPKQSDIKDIPITTVSVVSESESNDSVVTKSESKTESKTDDKDKEVKKETTKKSDNKKENKKKDKKKITKSKKEEKKTETKSEEKSEETNNIESNVIEETVIDPPCTDYESGDDIQYGDYSDDIPMTYIGTYTITFYSPDEASNIGAFDNVLTPYYSCAMPDASFLRHTLYIEGFGYRYCEDISPDGICDLYVGSIDEIPDYGMTTGDVYIID